MINQMTLDRASWRGLCYEVTHSAVGGIVLWRIQFTWGYKKIILFVKVTLSTVQYYFQAADHADFVFITVTACIAGRIKVFFFTRENMV